MVQFHNNVVQPLLNKSKVERIEGEDLQPELCRLAALLKVRTERVKGSVKMAHIQLNY